VLWQERIIEILNTRFVIGKKEGGHPVHVVMQRNKVLPTDRTSIPMREGRRSTLDHVLNGIDRTTRRKVLVSHKDVVNQYF
jgi:hypothetical protein